MTLHPIENRTLPRGHSAVLLSFCLLLAVRAPLFAGISYLAAGHPDGVALLAPPPATGSAEEAADLATVRAAFQGRTPDQTARAKMDSGLSFSLFTPAIGSAFDLTRLPKTESLLEQVKKDIQEPIDLPKNHFKRKRPYQMDTSLGLGKPEPSFGYPSGHSTRGTVYALLLSELYPEKREAILGVGRDIGWDRVMIGKHFPTDIYAGRVLAQAIMRELMSNPDFQRDLAGAKAEIAAVR